MSDSPANPAQLPGAWQLVRTYWRLTPGNELPISTAVGVLTFFLYTPSPGGTNDVLVGLLYAEIQAAAGLLGIVLAALAVVVGFFGDAYLKFLTRNLVEASGAPDYEEIHRLSFIFWVTCILAVSAAVACLLALWALSRGVSPNVLAAVTTFFFLWALLACLGLVRFVAQHLLIRAAQSHQDNQHR